jgi:spore coat polysaccharide biosynthesis predicted glycosyltransferase SpsG/RimJ/RimL family protein N-acetyltransferase
MGHLRRCLTLANEARRQGHESVFVQSSISGLSAPEIMAQDHRVIATSFAPSQPWDLKKNPDWTDPSGIADETADALAFVEEIESYNPDLVVLDHYFMTQRWVDQVRRALPVQFVTLEDLARPWKRIEFVVNGNLDGSITLKEESTAKTLIGPKYAFLSSEYYEIRARGLTPVDERDRILIFVGGGNTVGMTIRYLKMASKLGYQLDVVASSTASGLEELRNIVKLTQSAELHLDVPTLAPFYAQARLALGAGGTSSWERACLGVPSVVTSIAENQIPICRALEYHGLARHLGPFEDLDISVGSRLVADLAASAEDLKSMSEVGLKLIDGLGAVRTLRIVTGSNGHCTLRDAHGGDASTLLDWVNDPAVVQNSKSQRHIEPNEHMSWLQRVLNGKETRLFILDLSGLPVGQIRFDKKHDHVVLTYSIDRDFRSRGLGKLIVEMGLAAMRSEGEQYVEAFVRKDNAVSARVFFQLGFTEEPYSEGPFFRFRKHIGV